MVEIHPITPDPPQLHVSRLKLVAFVVIVVGVVVFGYVARDRTRRSDVADAQTVLGSDTRTIESYLPDTFTTSIASLSGRQSPIRPESLLMTGKELVASGAARFASAAGSQVEQVASGAARNVTDFIYKNTIERIIDTLIHSLPPERQEQYQK